MKAMKKPLSKLSQTVKQNGAIIVKANGQEFGYFWNGESVKFCSVEFARNVIFKLNNKQ
jgi:hypothetical protein